MLLRGARPKILLATGLVLVGLDFSHAHAPQHAGPERTAVPDVPEGAPAQPPEGFLALCERDPAECRESGEADGHDDAKIRDEAGELYWSDAFGAPGATNVPAGTPPAPAFLPSALSGAIAPGALPMTSERWAQVDQINQAVNRGIQMESDMAQYGKVDYWNVQSGKDEHGDCEDYALTKRHQLIASGIPPEVLSFGIVRTSWGELHAILILSTDEGDMVLDNLTPWIQHWDQTGYQWIERQTPGQPFDWRHVDAS